MIKTIRFIIMLLALALFALVAFSDIPDWVYLWGALLYTVGYFGGMAAAAESANNRRMG